MVKFAIPAQKHPALLWIMNQTSTKRETPPFYLRELDQLPPIRGNRIHPIKYIRRSKNDNNPRIELIPQHQRQNFINTKFLVPDICPIWTAKLIMLHVVFWLKKYKCIYTYKIKKRGNTIEEICMQLDGERRNDKLRELLPWRVREFNPSYKWSVSSRPMPGQAKLTQRGMGRGAFTCLTTALVSSGSILCSSTTDAKLALWDIYKVSLLRGGQPSVSTLRALHTLLRRATCLPDRKTNTIQIASFTSENQLLNIWYTERLKCQSLLITFQTARCGH